MQRVQYLHTVLPQGHIHEIKLPERERYAIARLLAYGAMRLLPALRAAVPGRRNQRQEIRSRQDG
jgi:hypothetical protein